MKRIILLFSTFFLSIYIFAQDTIVNWQTFENVAMEYTQKQKPILIFSYTKNDTLSKLMLDSTLENSDVFGYLNYLFYNIKFDLETFDTITFFNGQQFTHNPNEKYHSLAKLLIGDTIVSPSLIMFDKKAQGRVFEGFKSKDSVFPTLIYYSEEAYNSITYEEWEKYYYKTYPPGQKQIITRLNIRWITMSEMLEEQKTTPKKIFIDIYNNYNVSQTIMRLNVYNDPEIARYMNNYFYSVTVPLQSDEIFEIKGATYKNSGEPYKYHQFAVAVLNGLMKFPAFIILDEDFNLLDRIQFFTPKEQFSSITKFYGENFYKTMNYQQFIDQNKK